MNCINDRSLGHPGGNAEKKGLGYLRHMTEQASGSNAKRSNNQFALVTIKT